MSVILETTLGDITVDLYTAERPRSCLNFLKLCKVKYYNFCLVHKVERNFIAQTGDPTETGRGGESIFCRLYGEQAKFFEAETKPRLKHTKIGTLSLVNNGSNMNGSQFFLTLGENLDYLDGVHTVFGEVAEGLDVLMKINDSICDEEHRPYQDIRITHTVILDDPFDDPEGLQCPDRSPEPTEDQLKSGRIGADEEIDDTKGKSIEEIDEEIKDREAKARATILEMVGDIPDAEIKPPENVLFVCKLNPVTTAEDLEIIFSRFGIIKSCEVIKDKKTGESLQYAFIEFEKEEDCENAYFKMDNVLIDDRRIHVDFSQSVAKLQGKAIEFLKGKENSKAKYAVKDTAKGPQNDYELVFDDGKNTSANNKQEKKHKKKKKYKDRSPSYERKKKVAKDKKHSSRNRSSSSDKSTSDSSHYQPDKHDNKQLAHSASRSPQKSHNEKSHKRRRSSTPPRTETKKKTESDSKRHKNSSDISSDKNKSAKSYHSSHSPQRQKDTHHRTSTSRSRHSQSGSHSSEEGRKRQHKEDSSRSSKHRHSSDGKTYQSHDKHESKQSSRKHKHKHSRHSSSKRHSSDSD